MNTQTDFSTLKTKIEMAIDGKDFILSASLSAKMLSIYPQVAEAHYLNARAKSESGDKAQQPDALSSAERAVALDPNNFRYCYYCGSLYLEFRLYEFALPLLRNSVRIEPNAALSQLDLADCYLEIGKGQLAVAHYRAALKLESSSVRRDMIRSKLAHCMVVSGQPQEAAVLLNRLIKDGGVYYESALSELIISGKEKPNSPAGERVRVAIANANNSPECLEVLHLAMGRLFENAGDYDRAFEAWTRSREIAKTINYALTNHATEFEQIRRFYTTEVFERTKALANQTEVPVFIAGMPRSGTTLTEQIVAAHSQAIGVGELARFNKLQSMMFLAYDSEDSVQRLIASGEVNQHAAELLRIFRVVAGEDRPRIVEKTPHNFTLLGYFHMICPNARFIHIRRNPADTFISTYQNRFNRSHGYAYDQIEYVKEYLWHEQMMDLWKSLFPELILTINYEQLVAEPEHVAKKIFEHIDLPWEEQTLRFFESKKTVRTFSTHQVRNPINTKSVDRWRRYEKHLGPLLNALEEAKFEYKYIPV